MPTDRVTIGLTRLSGLAERAADRRARPRRPAPDRYRRPDPVRRPVTTGLPPGPRWPDQVQAVCLIPFRERMLPHLHRRYGDVFTVRMPPHGLPLVVFRRPEHIREIFAADPRALHGGEANLFLRTILGEDSMLLLEEEEHARARRLLTPAFSGPAMRGYRPMVREVARAEVGTWRPGPPISALARMNALTLEVILRVVFGLADGSARLTALRPSIQGVLSVHPLVSATMTLPRLLRFGPWRRHLEHALAIDDLLYAEIAERRGQDLAGRTDVLSRMMLATDGSDGTDGLSDAELRDQLVTLLLAGHETTANGLAWALQEVGRDPRQVARVVAAAREGDDGWLEAVFKESLRRHPILPMTVRILTEPTTIGGVRLPAGVGVAASMQLAHASADNHPEPEVFRPERFVDGAPPANTWFPFGGGVRRCLGAAFSQMEGVEILREVFSRLEIRAVAAETPRVRNITTVPRHGARIVVRPLT